MRCATSAVDYITETGDVRAVDCVDLDVAAGEFMAIVGESGCGKSTLLFAIAQLLAPPAEIAGGSVSFKGHDMVRLSADELRHMRWRDYSVVMQSAMNALNPMKSIEAQFRDTMKAHAKMSRRGDAPSAPPRCCTSSGSTPSTSRAIPTSSPAACASAP